MEISVDIVKNGDKLDLFISEEGSSGCRYTCPPELFGAVMQRYLDTQSGVMNPPREVVSPMYIACKVQFVDDDKSMDTIIKAEDTLDQYDDRIFFYGYTYEQLNDAMKKNKTLENEWRVLDIYGWSDDIEELLF